MRIRIIIFIVIIAVITAGNIPIFERFTITDGKSGHIVFLRSAKHDKEFYVSFIHSVNRTPVYEYYRISRGKIVLEKASFYSYGAGMPEAGEYGSGKPIVKDGMVQIENINKEFKQFTYFAGTYANHSLNMNEEQIFFSQFVKPQTPVTFEVKKISAITLLGTYLIMK